ARAVRYSEANTPQGPDQSHGTHRRPAGPGPGPGNALRPDAARLEGSASSREVLIRIHYGRAGFDPPEPPYGPGPEPRRCRGEGTTPRHATTPRRRPGLSPPSVAIAGFGRPPPTTAAGPVSDIPPRYRTHRTGKDRRPTGRPVHARTRATPVPPAASGRGRTAPRCAGFARGRCGFARPIVTIQIESRPMRRSHEAAPLDRRPHRHRLRRAHHRELDAPAGRCAGERLP